MAPSDFYPFPKLKSHLQGPQGFWEEGLFIFRELGSTSNYLTGFGEQAYSFGDLESPVKK